MYPTSNQGLNRETDDAVYFFTPSFHTLDNFSAHQVNIWGIKFSTAEHAYQYKKFSINHPEISQQILLASSPEAAKKVSDANKQYQPETWKDEKVVVMEEILRTKVQQHEDVREALKRSGKRTIIENSPFDGFWGSGPNGDGKNMVGKIWMEIRGSLII